MSLPSAGSHADAPRIRTFADTAAALFVLLVAPFVVFLERHHYSLRSVEVVSGVGIAAALALLTALVARHAALRVGAIALAAGLALDAQFDELGPVATAAAVAVVAGIGWGIRQHLARIVTLTGLAFLVSTIALADHRQPAAPSLTGGNDERPFVLHVVLDEHVGLAGLKDEGGSQRSLATVASFFDRHGFRRFDDAYSEYFWTRYSLSQMLNLSSGRHTPGLFRAGRQARYDLVGNPYFARVAAQGYAINVLQTTYLDVCPDPRTVAHCESYDETSLEPLQRSRLDRGDRFYALSAAYLRRLYVYGRLRRAGRLLERNADRPWVPDWIGSSIHAMPPLFVQAPPEHYGSIAARAIVERLIAAVSRARRGQYVFAHLMLPHYPYVFRSDCSPRPPSEWNARTDSNAPARTSNTPEGRALRYAQYAEQLECVYKDLDRLLAAIPQALRQDAVVILHGDHGSRINLFDPDADETRPLAARDLRDAYSTLLAVKSPGVPSGSDDRRADTGCVLAALVASEFRSASPDPACNPSHTVFKVSPQAQVFATTAVAATYAP